MAKNRVLVQYPPELIAEIDKMVGMGKRTPYLVELAKRDVKLHRQLEALAAATGIWKDEDHPELADGSEAYVRRIRSLGTGRRKKSRQVATATDEYVAIRY